MASRIKGLYVEIGGDTVKLQTALKDVDKQLGSTQSALKDVNKLLKLDPKNTELLAQKQKLLQDATSQTKDRLEQLKTAYDQAANTKDFDPTSLDALQREIQATEQSLKSLEDQAKQSGESVKSIGDRAGESCTKMGTAMMPVTAAIAGIGTAASAAWNELDGAYDAIAAGTGATGDALENLQQSFRNVYGNFPTDSEEAATAIADLNTRFGFTGEQLEGCTEQFLKFAQVNGTDVSSAIALVSRAMGDAGIDSSEYSSVLDSLTSASQASGISIDTLAESLTSFGAPMRALGFDMNESMALFAQWEKAGVNTKTAFSGMKTAISNWGKAGKDAKEEFKKTLQAIEEAPDIASATTLAIEAFGSKAGPDLADAIQGGRFSVEEMTAAIEASGGIVDQTFGDMQDPADKLKVAMNNLKLAGSDLGTQIQTTLTPMIDKVAETTKKLATWFQNLSPEMKDMIVKVGLLVAAIGPALLMLGQMGSGVKTLMDGFQKLKAGTTAAQTAIKALTGATSLGLGPLLAIVAAAAAVGAAFATLWKNNADFREKMTAIWDGIKEKVESFVEGVKERFSGLQDAFNNVVEFIKPIWGGFCNFLAPIFEGVWQQISNVLSTVLDGITGLLDVFIGLFTGDWETFWNGIHEIVDAIWNGIHDTINTVIDMISGCVQTFLSWFGIEWDGNLDGIKQTWETIWNGIQSFIDSTIDAIKGIVSAFISLFNGDWEGFTSGIKKVWEDVWTGMKNFGSDVWDAIKKICSDTWNSIKDTAANVWQNICDTIKKPIEDAKNFVHEMIENIKGFFDFSISWPHIPLPHFAISPSGWSFGDLLKGSIPSLGIDWYAEGGILTQPTIFGANGSQLLAGGEAGKEAVLPLKTLFAQMDKMFSDNQPDLSTLERLVSVVAANATRQIVLDSGVLVGEIAPQMDQAFASLERLEAKR